MAGKDPYRYFRIEAREIVDGLGRDLLALEAQADPDVVARLLRLAHTLKGASRIVKHRELAELSHALEDALAPLRLAPVAQRMDGALALVDRMVAQVVALPTVEQVAAATAAPVVVVPRTRSQSIAIPRADTGPLLGAAELLPRADGAALDERGLSPVVRDAEGRRSLIDGVLTQLAEIHARTNRLRAEVAGTPALASVDTLERELRELRLDTERLRFLPASALFTALARTLRDAGLATGKQIAFAGEGGETRVDAQVFWALQAALVQLVRNAVAHGIEAPAARVAAGKPAEGRVTVTFAIHGTRVVVTCSDDGRGLDLDAIRRAAGAPLTTSSDDLIAVLLRGGLSTAPQLSELAGRGIGLDVVRDAAQQLGGEVTARTAPRAGTTFTLTVPVALSAVTVLGAATLERSVAIPIAAIRRVVRIHTPELVAREGGGFAIPFDDALVPVGALSVILGFTFHSRTGSGSAIIMADEAGTLAALSAERTLGIEDAVVHARPARAPFDPIVRGFTLDADGLPRPVLEPAALIAKIRRGTVAPPGPRVRTLPILVVDDSLTSRMVEQSMLESGGYDVELASSAEEGLVKVAQRAYGLVLVDVEMPGMDGFGFIATLRAQPAHAALPAILVTSRDAPEDRRRGRDAGAQGYVIKSELEQATLIALIRTLVRT